MKLRTLRTKACTLPQDGGSERAGHSIACGLQKKMDPPDAAAAAQPPCTTTCQACRLSKVRCVKPDNKPGTPCTRCERLGLRCTDPPPSQKGKRSRSSLQKLLSPQLSAMIIDTSADDPKNSLLEVSPTVKMEGPQLRETSPPPASTACETAIVLYKQWGSSPENNKGDETRLLHGPPPDAMCFDVGRVFLATALGRTDGLVGPFLSMSADFAWHNDDASLLKLVLSAAEAHSIPLSMLMLSKPPSTGSAQPQHIAELFESGAFVYSRHTFEGRGEWRMNPHFEVNVGVTSAECNSDPGLGAFGSKGAEAGPCPSRRWIPQDEGEAHTREGTQSRPPPFLFSFC